MKVLTKDWIDTQQGLKTMFLMKLIQKFTISMDNINAYNSTIVPDPNLLKEKTRKTVPVEVPDY